MKFTPSIFLVPLLLAMIPAVGVAQSCTNAVCNAASPSEADVLAALPASGNKNATVVVNIPAGTSAWTSNLTYTVPASVTNLTIQGSTTVNCTGTAGASSFSCSATDKSIIEDNYGSSNSPLIINLSGANSTFRLTGLTIEGGSGSAKNNGILQIDGPSHNFRLDHIHFNATTYTDISSPSFMSRLFGDLEGVVDHVICDNGGSSDTTNCTGFSNNINDSIGEGDGPFAAPSQWGTAAFLYMEDSVVNGGMIGDCDTGGRFVVRYNSLKNGSMNSAIIHNHGTKSQAGRIRGCRAYEAYHNYIQGPVSNSYAAIGSAGGTALIWGNTMAGGYNRLAAFSATRNDGSETETNTPNGWGYCGTAVSSNGEGSGWDGNSNSSTGYPCLDGLGRGQGQALNGKNFPNAATSATGKISFPEEYLEPIYFWGNTIPNGLTEMDLRDQSSQFNRDVYIEAPSFNGSSGTGSGPLSARPASCTPGPGGTFGASPTGSYGVAYFATDANGGKGELYVCTSANTWTGIYQPYTYPHPLDGGGSPAPPPPAGPGAPTNLTGLVH